MPTVILDIDFIRADTLLVEPFSILRHVVREAIAQERERCAQVVENMGRSGGRIRRSHKMIAAEIRSGRPRIGKAKP